MYSVVAQEDIVAVTSSGEQVLLKSNGTWIYLDKPEIPLIIDDFYIIPRGVNYDQSRYSNDVILNLIVRNISGVKIKGYRIKLQIANGFGDILHILQLTSGNSTLENNESEDAGFVFEDNQFIDDEVYDSLVAYSKDNLIFVILEATVLK